MQKLFDSVDEMTAHRNRDMVEEIRDQVTIDILNAKTMMMSLDQDDDGCKSGLDCLHVYASIND